MGEDAGRVRGIGQRVSQILAGPMLILVEAAPPFRTVRYVIDDACVGNVHPIASLAVVVAQLPLRKFLFHCRLLTLELVKK